MIRLFAELSGHYPKPSRDLAQDYARRPEAGGCLTARRERATLPQRLPKPADGPRKLNRADRRELLTDSLQPARFRGGTAPTGAVVGR
jgi:hypothetical protein